MLWREIGSYSTQPSRGNRPTRASSNRSRLGDELAPARILTFAPSPAWLASFSASVSTFINETGAEEPAAYQVAFNGMSVDPGTADRKAAMLALFKLPGVKNVYLDYAHEPDLYTSTGLINAPEVWESAAVGGRANAGAGIKVASMDGGVHKDAPMFSGEGFSYPPDFPPTGLGLTDNNNGKIIASRACEPF